MPKELQCAKWFNAIQYWGDGHTPCLVMAPVLNLRSRFGSFRHPWGQWSVSTSSVTPSIVKILWHFFLWRAYSVSTARFSPKIRKFKNSKIQKIEKKHENSKIRKFKKLKNHAKIQKFKSSKKQKNIRKFENLKKHIEIQNSKFPSTGIHITRHPALATHQAEKIIDKGQEMKAPLLKNAASMLQKYPSKTSSKRHDMTRITWKNASTHSRKSFKQEMWRETYKRHHHVWGDWTEMQANLVQNDPANTSRAKGSS